MTTRGLSEIEWEMMVARDGIEPPTPAFRRAAGAIAALRANANARPE